MLVILDQLNSEIKYTFGDADCGLEYFKDGLTNVSISGNELFSFLKFWSKCSKKPILLFIDEIDSLVGDSLILILRQIRTGYTDRPSRFPQSICLVGERNIRDADIWSKDCLELLRHGGSPFKIWFYIRI